MRTKECYTGTRKCGCLIAIISKECSKEDLDKELEQYKKSKYKIEEMNIKDAAKKLKDCKCKKGKELF